MAEENSGTRGTDSEAAAAEAPPSRNRRTLMVWVAALVAMSLIAAAVFVYANRDSDTSAESVTDSGAVVDGSSAGTTGTASQTGADPTGRPTAPAPKGSELTTVTQPPLATLAMIEPSKLEIDARYRIVFSPFGYGPTQGGESSLVIRVTEATAVNESAKAIDLTGQNLLASVTSGQDAVAIGGVYAGVLSFVPQGDLLSPVVGEIEPAE